MKKTIFALAIFFGLLAIRPVFAQEIVNDFHADLSINQDGTIRVVETIDYDFGTLERHGIFRDIPYSYQTDRGRYNLRLSNISVVGPGSQTKFSQSRAAGMLKLKIGDENQTVFGRQRFIISYTVGRAINFFNNQDELYWNITGNGWPVPIESASADIQLPANLDLSGLHTACYAGAVGSKTSCNNILFPDLTSLQTGDQVSLVEFRQGALAAGEGLSVVIGLPKGVISQPTALSLVKDLLFDNYYILLPLVIFAVMFYLWFSRGRDPKGRGTIIAQFDAPDNLTPAEIGTIVDEQADSLDISAEIIQLAVKGYLKITQIKEKALLIDKEDYLLEKLKEQNDLENDFDRYLLTALFKGKTSVKLSELKKTFYKDLAKIKTMIYDTTASKGYFVSNPARLRKIFMVVAGLFAIAVVYGYEALGILNVAGLALSAVIIALFGWRMPARTAKGVTAREHILGLKEYLRVAEKDRLVFANAPAKKPEVFEKFLPYAIALKVEKEWAGQFAGIYENNSPGWYSSYNHSTFSALVLTDSLHNFTAKTNAVLGASAAGHGSGFGGGGFSGGGFGGGGGGSW